MTAYRYDYEVITQWIEPGEKVLDLAAATAICSST